MSRARTLVLTALVIVVVTVFGGERTAAAAVRRYALVVGDNRGDASDGELYYAESDGRRVYDVLKDLGGFAPADLVLLQGDGAGDVQSALITLNDRIRATIGSGSEAVLFVYYSGHGAADALHLNGTHLDLSVLEQLVRGSAATFRVLVLDACRSGALTRVKGGRPAAPFALSVDERLAGEGLVLLSSSAANEDAQESDELQGSFFTHYFVSALLGAGDEDHDGRVTLEEAYRAAYQGTLRASSATVVGLQHPTFRYELRGAGELPLTDLQANARRRASLGFPPGRTYLVLAGDDHGPVAGEVPATAGGRTLSVRAGRYFIRGRADDALLEGTVDAPDGASVYVSDAQLHRIEYARLVRKGGGGRRLVREVDAGYVVATALPDAQGLCQGAFAGVEAHYPGADLGARLEGCHAGFTNETISSSTWLAGAELRAGHTWDLPRVSVALGATAGGWVLHQSFTTRGVAPATLSPAFSFAPTLAVRADVGAGVTVFTESAPTGFVYAQAGTDGARSLGPYFAFRQSLGVGKSW